MHRFSIYRELSLESQWELAAQEALNRLNATSVDLYVGLKVGHTWIANLSVHHPDRMSIDITDTDETAYTSRQWEFRATPALMAEFVSYRDALVGEALRAEKEQKRRLGVLASSSRFDVADWVMLDQNRHNAHENGRLYLQDILHEKGLDWGGGTSRALFVVFAFLYCDRDLHI
jgi:hypothetical protein